MAPALNVALVIVSVAVPVLVAVTCCVVLVRPTSTLENASAGGATLICGVTVPVPVTSNVLSVLPPIFTLIVHVLVPADV